MCFDCKIPIDGAFSTYDGKDYCLEDSKVRFVKYSFFLCVNIDVNVLQKHQKTCSKCQQPIEGQYHIEEGNYLCVEDFQVHIQNNKKLL